MSRPALNRDALDAMLASYIASLPVIQIVLFTNLLVPTPLTVFAGITEVVASWYARQALTFGAIYADSAGALRVNAPSVQYTYSGADAPVIVYGWAIIKHVVGPPIVDTLVAVYALPAPVTLAGPYDALVIDPSIEVPLIAYAP